MNTSLGHYPEDIKWKFDDGVTNVFEDMLYRSIPQYDVMRRSVFDIAKNYVQSNTHIVDLGCSKGESIAPLISEFGNKNKFIGIEISEPMYNHCNNRFKKEIESGFVSIDKADLKYNYPVCTSSVTMSVLCLQFIPINYRQDIIKKVYDTTVKGGAFIIVEKVLGNSAEIDSFMIKEYHKMKGENGYSCDEIERKKLSLEGVLVPITAKWNEDLLKQAGFSSIDCFWRWMNFCGWIAIK